jgi:tRNA/tmRNA/rRNA uracil-C5-methylase (TrmA/RlmC/RlmD family)
VHSFDEYLAAEIHKAAITPRSLARGECQSSGGTRCSLCNAGSLDYETEVRIKRTALERFWKRNVRGCHLDPLVVSPRGRFYRTVTKRKVFLARNQPALGLTSPAEVGMTHGVIVERCVIEPPQHAHLYSHIHQSLPKPFARPLLEQLTYVIIKGSYDEFSIILNVRDVSAETAKAANTLSKSLTRASSHVKSVFLYEDPTGGRYYLGSKNPRRQPRYRRLYGDGEIYQKVHGRSFKFSPLSFSQINQSMVDTMVEKSSELLQLQKARKLFDLYSGYGLFSLCLSEKVLQAVGVEISPQSVNAATANARRQHATNVRFIRSDITAETMPFILNTLTKDDAVLLDPPRNGTRPGVIEYIAARKPSVVLHILCNIDLIATELKRWQAGGYLPARAVPLDMFPGTSSIETLVLLTPAR